ncbi:hypothetical protein ACIBI4_16745 [Streptomyces sp. NPDC050418]|uniref:hypothetical protein n=1 Tax=Streptomyces sp. NPDC050418 TaxID=3365612 RepID=UPI00379AB4E8
MGLWIGLLAAFVVALGLCLLVLRRRGGSGESGALERGAAERAAAAGLAGNHINQQTMGPGGM